MVMVSGWVLLGLLIISVSLNIKQRFALRNLDELNGRTERLLHVQRRQGDELANELETLRSNRLSEYMLKHVSVGDQFYYPTDTRVRHVLKGRKCQIIRIENGKIYSMVIDEDGNFIIDISPDNPDGVWYGDAGSYYGYVFIEVKNRLKYDFVK